MASAATGRAASEERLDDLALMLPKTREGSAGAATPLLRLAAAEDDTEEESAERESIEAEAILSEEVEGGGKEERRRRWKVS